MKKYRKKPVVIEAMQARFGTAGLVQEWMDSHGFTGALWDGIRWHIKTLEGVMVAERNDWIIRGVEGEFYPVKPSIFAATYDEGETAEAAAKSMRPALAAIKLICLTETDGVRALGRITRICIDAGIAEHLDELKKAQADGGAKP